MIVCLLYVFVCLLHVFVWLTVKVIVCLLHVFVCLLHVFVWLTVTGDCMLVICVCMVDCYRCLYG